MWWEISTNNMQFESFDFPTFVYKNNKNAYAAIVINGGHFEIAKVHKTLQKSANIQTFLTLQGKVRCISDTYQMNQ